MVSKEKVDHNLPGSSQAAKADLRTLVSKHGLASRPCNTLGFQRRYEGLMWHFLHIKFGFLKIDCVAKGTCIYL